eukprot:gnl/TRDRNA2_/TRDRNA2_86009_c0_seq1.p1 gnl/TRDRNA2_/TRDRNA2_86009_c0~~gnl/TRDRNA2_/TRDRNA2_86009_c0_seq1.p1  ORF type:complete len:625 (-),score=110.48 gnl/TRDRNA2_/TRDRNA2_86009_c0_seq1:103-1779(-)
MVREGETPSTKKLDEKLSTGAIVEEIEVKAEKLHYKLLSGSGPKEGWVTIKLPDKDLCVKTDKKPPADASSEKVAEEEPKRQPPAWKVVVQPQIEYGDMKDAAARNDPGDYYGIKFPHTKDQLVEMGAKWLTEAFRKSGVLSKTNSVTKLTDAKEFVGGGAGLKCTFSVEYKEDKPWLHKNLFAKLPHKPGGSDRYYVSCMWNHDRPEMIFNIFLQDTVPLRVPKFYYGDISAKTTNFILITEAIPWTEKGKCTFAPNEIEPAYDKYMDWDLPDGGPMYYTAAVRAMGKMAAYHKLNKLHPKVNDMFPMPDPCPFIPPGMPGLDPSAKLKAAAQADQLIKFVTETAKAVFPDEITDKAFLEKWKADMLHYMNYMVEVDCFNRGAFQPNPNDYVGLTHNNLQIDNAFFWRNEDNKVEIGLLDWGVLACSPLSNSIQGCISGASVEVLLEHRDNFLQAFIDSYAEHGGPRLDFETFKAMSQLGMMGWSSTVIQNVVQVLKFTKQKEWAEIKDWMDPKLIGRFQTRAHTTQFKESLMLWKRWDLAAKFKEWKAVLQLPDKS